MNLTCFESTYYFAETDLCGDELEGDAELAEVFVLALHLLVLEVGGALLLQLVHRRVDLLLQDLVGVEGRQQHDLTYDVSWGAQSHDEMIMGSTKPRYLTTFIEFNLRLLENRNASVLLKHLGMSPNLTEVS